MRILLTEDLGYAGYARPGLRILFSKLLVPFMDAWGNSVGEEPLSFLPVSAGAVYDDHWWCGDWSTYQALRDAMNETHNAGNF